MCEVAWTFLLQSNKSGRSFPSFLCDLPSTDILVAVLQESEILIECNMWAMFSHFRTMEKGMSVLLPMKLRIPANVFPSRDVRGM